jgi:hypothetical protein
VFADVVNVQINGEPSTHRARVVRVGQDKATDRRPGVDPVPPARVPVRAVAFASPVDGRAVRVTPTPHDARRTAGDRARD